MRVPLIVLALFLFLTAGAAEEMLRKISANFSDIRTLRADFTQTREIRALDARLVMKGSFALERFKRMAWNMDSPLRSICIISGEELLQWDEDSGKALKLSASRLPWLKLLFTNLSGWMTADFGLLEKQFEIRAAAPARLVMTPKEEALKAYLAGLELEFDENFSLIRRVRIEEAGGDLVTIEFFNTVKNRPVPEETWQVPPAK